MSTPQPNSPVSITECECNTSNFLVPTKSQAMSMNIKNGLESTKELYYIIKW